MIGGKGQEILKGFFCLQLLQKTNEIFQISARALKKLHGPKLVKLSAFFISLLMEASADFHKNFGFFEAYEDKKGTKVYVQNWSEPSSCILHRYHLTRGSMLTSQDYSPSSVVYMPEPIRAI